MDIIIFSIERKLEAGPLSKNGKISVWKIINNKITHLCSIKNERDICKLWIRGGYLVSADSHNQITVWEKMVNSTHRRKKT